MSDLLTAGATPGYRPGPGAHLRLISGTQAPRRQTPHFPRERQGAPRPLSIGPLLALYRPPETAVDPGPVGSLANHLHRRFGVPRSQGRTRIYRWMHTGLTVAQADRLAISLGHHPAEIWGDDWWAVGALEVDEEGLWI